MFHQTNGKQKRMYNISALEHATNKIKKKLNINDEQLYFYLGEGGYFEARGSLFQSIRYGDDIDSINDAVVYERKSLCEQRTAILRKHFLLLKIITKYMACLIA